MVTGIKFTNLLRLCINIILVQQAYADSPHNSFLETFSEVNEAMGCSWIFVSHEYQASEFGNPISTVPKIILNSKLNQTFEADFGVRRSLSWCNFVTVSVPEKFETTLVGAFIDFLNESNWASLFSYKDPMRYNYFLILGNENMVGSLMLNQSAPFWSHTYKAGIYWKANGIRVTTACWHCGLNVRAENFRNDKSVPALLTSEISSEKDYQLSSIFHDYTRDLNQKSLLVLAGTSEPGLTCALLLEKFRLPYSKFTVPFMWFVVGELASRLNFSCILARRAPTAEANTIDLYVSQPFLPKFYKRFQPSPALGYEQLNFCYIKPSKAHSWKNIFYAFQPRVWLVILVTWVLASAILYAVYYRRRKGQGVCRWFWNMFASLLFQQDVSRKIRKADAASPGTTRSYLVGMVVPAWLVLGIIVTAAYCSNLSSILTRPMDLNVYPKTFQALAEEGWEVGSSHAGLFSDPHTLNITPAFYSLMTNFVNFSSEKACFREALNRPKFACIGYVSTMTYYALDVFNNEFHISFDRYVRGKDKTFTEIGAGFLWRWSNPFRDAFSRIVRDLGSGGIPNYWGRVMSRNLLVKRIHTEDEKAGEIRIMGLKHLQGSFIVLGAGLGGALLVFLCERIVKPFRSMWDRLLAS